MVSNNGNKIPSLACTNVCCGYEIVIGAGITFPIVRNTSNCQPNGNLSLRQRIKLLHVDDIKERKKNHTAA